MLLFIFCLQTITRLLYKLPHFVFGLAKPIRRLSKEKVDLYKSSPLFLQKKAKEGWFVENCSDCTTGKRWESFFVKFLCVLILFDFGQISNFYTEGKKNICRQCFFFQQKKNWFKSQNERNWITFFQGY